jgi:hypothetical protein
MFDAAAGVINAPVVHMGYRYDSAAVIDAKPELPSRGNLNGDPGSLLVRPDQFIAWRATTGAGDHGQAMAQVLAI